MRLLKSMTILLILTATAARADITKILAYNGTWKGACVNTQTGEKTGDSLTFSTSAFPQVDFGIGSNVIDLTVGNLTRLQVSVGQWNAVNLNLEHTDDFTLHFYGQAVADYPSPIEMKMSFTLRDQRHLNLREDIWDYGEGKVSLQVYDCKYGR